MLRVGLTGELGSGKSTVARMFAGYGATVLSSDEMGRALMQPGQAVYQAIVERFGRRVVERNGQLNRQALAELAFSPIAPRVEELNAIVHPAVLAEQERQIAAVSRVEPNAIVVVESALLFTTQVGTGEGGWSKRFDAIVLVTAPDEVKLARFIERSRATGLDEMALRADGLARLARQRMPADAAVHFRIENESGIDELREQVHSVWMDLQRRAHPS